MSNSVASIVESRARELGPLASLHILRRGIREPPIPYERLLRASGWLGRLMQGASGGDAEKMVIAAQDPVPTLVAFFAALRTGVVPTVLPGPRALGGLDRFLENMQSALEALGARTVLAVEADLVPPHLLPTASGVITLGTELNGYGFDPDLSPFPIREARDGVLYQSTSASTGAGHMVAISNANLLANLAAIKRALPCTEDEVICTWLPMYHDMGLIGAVLFSFFHGYPLVLMRPADFIKRPSRWLNAISSFGCTLTSAPNFGYEYAIRFAPEDELEGCDLSGLRAPIVGAEPVRYATLRRFVDRFAPRGFRPETFRICYGLAESTVGVSMSPPQSRPRYLLMTSRASTIGGPVQATVEASLNPGLDQPHPVGTPVFSVGRPLDGVQLDLLNEDGRPVDGERIMGEVAVSGPSVARGYVGTPDAQCTSFSIPLRTGDLGFRDKGELFILERTKQVIIRNGRNYFASLLEDKAAEILHRRVQDLIVFERSILEPNSPIVLLVENVGEPPRVTEEQTSLLRGLDLPIDEILFSRRRVIPRTTSGKKRYFVCRQRLSLGIVGVLEAVDLSAALAMSR